MAETGVYIIYDTHSTPLVQQVLSEYVVQADATQYSERLKYFLSYSY